MANRMTRERALSVLESMYCAQLAKLDETRAAVRRARRKRILMQSSHADYLSSTIPVREDSVAALGFAIDSLLKN